MRLVVCSLIFFTIVSLAPLSAAISFGSRKSALEVSAGSLAFSANSVGLTKGTIRKTGSGNFTGDAGEYLDCTKMRIETDHSTTYKGVGLDGLLYLNDATITLEDSDVLSVDGGQVAETVTVNGAVSVPSTLQGFGSFAAGISVNSTRKLVMRWDSEMAQDLTLNSTTAGTTTLLLEQDLRFAPGYSVEAGSETGTAQIDFNRLIS